MKETYAGVRIDKNEVMACLRNMTIHDEAFDHRPWSLWDAEVLEQAAQLIREGYARERKES
jgi:hypothetical protein